MTILGIETSCDETGAAIVENGTKILSNIVASSQELHLKTGGIVPEVAAREQVKCIIPVIKETLRDPKQTNDYSFDKLPQLRFFGKKLSSKPNFDAIAVTIGPGLIGSLLVGVETAKTLAYLWNKPIVPVNHLLAHVYANWLKPPKSKPQFPSKNVFSPPHYNNTYYCSKGEKGLDHFNVNRPLFPAIALIASGGHTELILMKNHGKYICLGSTRDDAAGEAFDKIARLLGLGYPGGPAISATAEKFKVQSSRFKVKLPRPMIETEDFDFSFSGLKTAVIRELGKQKLTPSPCFIVLKQWNKKPTLSLPPGLIEAFAYEVQEAITDVLVEKTIRATKKYKVKSVLLAGGVAANDLLRQKFKVQSSKFKVKFFAPAKNLCTDNAAVVASCAYFNCSPVPWQELRALPSLGL